MIHLNRIASRKLVFAGLLTMVLMTVALGTTVRRENYVNAHPSDIARGGLLFDVAGVKGTIALAGDSNGSTYAKADKKLCHYHEYRAVILSIAAGDPLPSKDGAHGRLLLDTLATVKKRRPDILILACHRSGKIKNYPQRLTLAVQELTPYVGKIVLFNQPASLPPLANRAGIRSGIHPPFAEEPATRQARLATIISLAALESSVVILDISSQFESGNGALSYFDEYGRPLYQDGSHLSHYGAERVMKLLAPILQSAEHDITASRTFKGARLFENSISKRS